MPEITARNELFRKALVKVAEGNSLDKREARAAFDAIMGGQVSEIRMAAFLMGLRVKGETVNEISGAVSSMRAHMTPVLAPEQAIDIVGTGGDGHHTYNVSTAAGLLIAACGLPVAKHGNRGVSSSSGAADILGALGIKAALPAEGVQTSLQEAGIGFMFAPQFHPAMRHVVPVRKELGLVTIFNLLGPLCNPASVKRAVIGVFSPELLEPFAKTLIDLGMERAWVVHGSGLDELTTTGDTDVISLKGGRMKRFTLTPEGLGLKRVTLDDLRGGSPEENAWALKEVLAGKPSPYADIAILNAAAGLKVGGLCDRLEEGMDMVQKAIASGRAQDCLSKLIDVTNRVDS